MVIQAGSVLSFFFRQIPAAGPQHIQLIHQFNGILDRRRACIRAEIARLIFFHLSGEKHSGKRLPHRHFYIGISLIVLQQCIITRTVFFNQIILQYQRFQFRVRYNILKPGYLRHHHVNLRTAPDIFTEVGTYAVMEVYGFPDIDYRVVPVMHNIYSRFCRQFP